MDTNFSYSPELWKGAIVNGDTYLVFGKSAADISTPSVYDLDKAGVLIASANLPDDVQSQLKFKDGVAEPVKALIRHSLGKLENSQIDTKHPFFATDAGQRFIEIFGLDSVNGLYSYILPRLGKVGAEPAGTASTTTLAFNNSFSTWEGSWVNWYNQLAKRLESPDTAPSDKKVQEMRPSVNISMALLELNRRALTRFTTLVHEGRHSNCQASETELAAIKPRIAQFLTNSRTIEGLASIYKSTRLTQARDQTYPLARAHSNDRTELTALLEKNCSNSHSICKRGAFVGQEACDDHPFGAYAIDGLVARMLRETCTRCSEKEIQALITLTTDRLSRVELKDGKTVEQMWHGEAGRGYFIPLETLFK